MAHRKSPTTKRKARLILHEGLVHGKRLTRKQRGLFGSIVSGKFGHKKK